jgi:SlyX protein
VDKETEDRLVAVETKLAFMEDFVNKLQIFSVEQTKEIERMRQENQLLSGKFRELQDSLEDIPNRRPPHY